MSDKIQDRIAEAIRTQRWGIALGAIGDRSLTNEERDHWRRALLRETHPELADIESRTELRRGSAKQVAWAMSLRLAWTLTALELDNRLRHPPDACTRAEEILSCDYSARWWIDRRELDVSELLLEIKRAKRKL